LGPEPMIIASQEWVTEATEIFPASHCDSHAAVL
jgi:hypothetical protein